MDVQLIGDTGVVRHRAEDLPALLERGQGLAWVDIPTCDEEAVRVLSEVFGFHPLAIRDCVERNHVAKVHAYPDHVFVVLHAPERGQGGHVHYLELDQFIGPGYLVTVHGPLNPVVDAELALRETRAVLRRVEAGRLHPSSSYELSHAIVSALTRHQEAFVATLAREVGLLEQQVMDAGVGDPEQFLEEMFRARHGLVAVRTMATLSSEIYGRMATLTRFLPEEARPLVADLVDQFERVRGVADGQKEFLHGVIEFYRTPDRDQDDHCRGASSRDRGRHPADHRYLVGLWDEHHRQRPHRLPSPGRGAGGHDGHLSHPAALGQAPRLVVTATPTLSAGCSEHGAGFPGADPDHSI